MSEEKTPAEHWAERAPFYASVGQGISIWSSMEGRLVEIAAHLLGTSNRKAGLVLYSIMSFFTWLQIIDELFILETRYSAHRSAWGVISDKLRSLNDIRVRLAHHTVWDIPYDANQDAMALRPGRYDSRSKSKKHAPLTDPEIAGFTSQIFDIDGDLKRLVEDIEITKNLPPTSSLGTLLLRLADQQSTADAPPHNSDKAQ